MSHGKFDHLSGAEPPLPPEASPRFALEQLVEDDRMLELVIHSDREIDEYLYERLRSLEGVDSIYRVGKYTVGLFKGCFFEWADVDRRVNETLERERKMVQRLEKIESDLSDRLSRESIDRMAGQIVAENGEAHWTDAIRPAPNAPLTPAERLAQLLMSDNNTLDHTDDIEPL